MGAGKDRREKEKKGEREREKSHKDDKKGHKDRDSDRSGGGRHKDSKDKDKEKKRSRPRSVKEEGDDSFQLAKDECDLPPLPPPLPADFDTPNPPAKQAVKKEVVALKSEVKEEEKEEEKPAKPWSLDEESSDEEEEREEKVVKTEEGAEEEIDPLDMFMEGVEEQVKLEDEKNPVSRGLNAKSLAKRIRGRRTLARTEEEREEEGSASDDGAGSEDDNAEEKGQIIGDEDVWDWGKEDTEASTVVRDLKPVNHSLIDYINFRKDFYTPTKEAQSMTAKEIKALRKANDATKVKDPLKCSLPPIRRWEECGLSDKIYEFLKGAGYTLPFSIQAQAIPYIMAGRDVIGCATTGSGKTLAYLLPMIRHIKDQPPRGAFEGPIGVVLVPTRELAVQVQKEAKKLGTVVGLRAVAVYGGTAIRDQIADIRRGADIITATPGRLIDMLMANKGRVMNLQRSTFLVFDEADRMFDMGFGPQIERIAGNIRPDRQVVMFSATFPRQVEASAKSFMSNPLEVIIGQRSVAAANVTQHVEMFDSDAVKWLRLLQLLGNWVDKGKIIVFVDTKVEVDELLKDLSAAGYGAHAIGLHGGMEQIDREYSLHYLRQGERQILVATSVAARGLDVLNIEVVINYKCPDHFEDYIHRVGRTGRAGKRGNAYTFMNRNHPTDERMATELVKALEQSNNTIPEELQDIANSYWDKARNGLVVYKKHGYGGAGIRWGTTEENQKKRKQIKEQARAMGLSDDLGGGSDDEEQIEDEEDLGTRAGTDSVKRKAGEISGNKKLITMNPKLQRTQNKIDDAKNFAMILSMETEVSKEKEARGHFTAELEINDYHHKARQVITTKEALMQIGATYNCDICTKGEYTKSAGPLPPGKRKLYLHIGGSTSADVRGCKKHIEDRLLEKQRELMERGITREGPETSAFGRIRMRK